MIQSREALSTFFFLYAGEPFQITLLQFRNPVITILHLRANGRISFRLGAEKFQGVYCSGQIVAIEHYIDPGANSQRDGFVRIVVAAQRFHFHVVAKDHARVTQLLP